VDLPIEDLNTLSQGDFEDPSPIISYTFSKQIIPIILLKDLHKFLFSFLPVTEVSQHQSDIRLFHIQIFNQN
jgi:hypothetical protein